MGSTAPVGDDSYIELVKLQKLFEARFTLKTSYTDSSPRNLTPVEAHGHDNISMNLDLQPTDPDFDKSLLGTDKAIHLTLCLRRSHGTTSGGTSTSSQKTGPPRKGDETAAVPAPPINHYSLLEPSDITISNTTIPKDVQLVIKKVLLTFLSKYRNLERYAVYESLKFLDREIRHIFELCASRRSKAEPNTPANATWSLEEQKTLEFALSKTKGIADAQLRWAAVANIVKTRNAEECRRRFQRCRELLKSKNEEPKKVTEMPEDYGAALSRSAPLRLAEINLVKISVFNVVSFVIQLSCTRCESSFDVGLTQGEKSTISVVRSCEKCTMSHRCQFQPQIAFNNNPVIGNLSLENCVFMDFLSGEFYVTCEDCDTHCKLRDVHNGSHKNSNCRGCFAKLTLGFNSVAFGYDTSDEPAPATASKKPPARVERKKQTPGGGLKVGTPLPENGACKHYKKSFRWFRFPCCGKLFPCDCCHDESSDHPYEQAHMIVCGHCSTQQTVSNKKCKNCDKGYTGSTSSYWEGGKGCRDGTKLNRKDTKKYRLMRRQTEQAQTQTDKRDKTSSANDTRKR